MKFFTVLLVLFYTFSAASQTTEKPQTEIVTDTSYTFMYNKLKELYIKQKKSLSQVRVMEMHREFLNKSNMLENTTAKERVNLVRPEDLIKWIKDNIEKTDFPDFDAVLAADKEIDEATAIVMKENAELYEYLSIATKIHAEIYPKVILDVELGEY